LSKMKIDLKTCGHQFLSQLEPLSTSFQVKIGISSLCAEPEKLHYGYKEALKSLEVAAMKKNLSSVILASELGYLTIMLDARKPEELERFATNLLGSIEHYDQLHNTEFLKTIYYYLEHECNVYQTARVLNISNSGMTYRLQRAKELFRLDFSVSSVRLNLQLAFEIFLVLGKWSG
jgi:purine catabolism regulator